MTYEESLQDYYRVLKETIPGITIDKKRYQKCLDYYNEKMTELKISKLTKKFEEDINNYRKNPK